MSTKTFAPKKVQQNTLDFRPRATHTVAEVLRTNTTFEYRTVLPLAVPVGTPADAVLDAAAKTVRDMYTKGRTIYPYNPAAPESFFDACSRLAQVAFDVEDSLQDDTDAAIAKAIFQKSQLITTRMHPVSKSALQSIAAYVKEIVHKLRLLLATQESLDLGGVAA